MKKINKEIYKYVTIVIFFVMIVGPGLVWPLVGPLIGESSTENRKLAEMPQFDISNIEKYPSNFDKYYNDHAPFRKDIGTLWSKLNYMIFRDSVSDAVVVGRSDDGMKDVWLFYDNSDDLKPIVDAQGLNSFTDEDHTIIYDTMKRNLDMFNKANIDFYMLVLPNKENIYKDYLPDKIKLFTDESRTDIYMKQMTKDFSNVIYMKDRFLEARNDRHEEIYYKQDTHYNELGAFYAYSDLMKKIAPNFKTDDYTVTFEGVDDKHTDLALLMNLDNFFHDTVPKVHFLEEVDYKSTWSGSGADAVEIFTNSNAPIKKTIFVVGDSFRTALLPYLAKTYSKVISLNNNYYKTGEYTEFEPDVVLQVIVERNFGGSSKIRF